MNKKIITLIFILLLVIVASAMTNSYVISREVYALAESHFKSETDAIESSIDNWVGEHLYFFENITDIINNFSEENLTYVPTFNKYLKIRFVERKLTEFYIGFEDGKFTTGTSWIPDASYDARLRPWYIKAKNEKTTVICDPYIDKKTKRPVITFSSPFFRDKKIVGVIGLDLQLTILNNFLKETLLNKDFNGIIFDKNGMIIANTLHPKTIGKNISGLHDSSILHLYKKAFSTDSVKAKIFSENNCFFATSRIPQTEWGMVLIAKNNIILKSAKKISVGNVMLNIIFVLVAAFLLILFYRTGKTLKETNVALNEKILELNEAKAHIEKINVSLDIKSKTDGLTHIFNRGYLNDFAENIWGECLEKQQALSMIIMDIDHFKKYNDHYGHPGGDEVLLKLCNCVQQLLNEDDFFARYGGEEFAVISIQRSADEMILLAENIKNAVYALNIEHLESSYKRISVSLGVNTYIPFSEDTLGNFIRKTDSALYEAKMGGRNKVAVYIGNKMKKEL